MKKAFLILLAAGISLGVSAQEKKGMHRGKQQHHKQDRLMAHELNLSAGQKEQARQINADFRKKMADLSKNENITVKEFRDRKEALHRERKAKLDGLLTPDQKNRMAALKAGRKKEREAHFSRKLERMKIDLQLSDAQVAKLQSHREATARKMQAIRENEKLSRTERKDQLMAAREEAKAEKRKILTPDQLKKMEEMKKKHADNRPAK